MNSLKLTAIFTAHVMSMLAAMPSQNTVQMPAKCANQSFCFEVDDQYPQKELDDILSALPIGTIEQEEAENRVGDPTEDIKLCETNVNNGRIYYIVDTKGDTRVVAQTKQFMQRFEVRQCRNPGLLKDAPTPFNEVAVCQYTMTCFEELVPVNFLVMNRDRSGVEVATIKDGLPMGCACNVSYPPLGKEECLVDYPEELTVD